MTLEEDSDLVGLLISPPEVISEVVGNSPEETRSVRLELTRELAALLRNSGKRPGKKHGEDDQSEIGFQDVRARRFLKKRECRCRIARSD